MTLGHSPAFPRPNTRKEKNQTISIYLVLSLKVIPKSDSLLIVCENPFWIHPDGDTFVIATFLAFAKNGVGNVTVLF